MRTELIKTHTVVVCQLGLFPVYCYSALFTIEYRGYSVVVPCLQRRSVQVAGRVRLALYFEVLV